MLNWNDVIIWQILSVFFSILLVVLTIPLILISRKKKEFIFYILEDLSLIKNNHNGIEKINIISNNEKIDNVSLVVFMIRNYGNVPILEEDFKKPIIISLGDNAKIINLVIEPNPSDMDVKMSQKENYIELFPTLFNRNDEILFKVLINNFKNLTVTTRIVGVKKIRDFTEKRELARRLIEEPNVPQL